MSELTRVFGTAAIISSVGCFGAWWGLHHRSRSPRHVRIPFAGIAAWLAFMAAATIPAGEAALVGVVMTIGTFLLVLGIIAEGLPFVPARLTRWVGAVTAALVLAGCGVRIDAPGPGGHPLPLGAASFWLSAAWMSAVTLLVLLTNRGEGLVSGVGAISSMALLAVSALAPVGANAPVEGRLLCAGLAGALIPATVCGLIGPRVRFGGGATLAVGITLAAATVLGYLKHMGLYTIAIPILLLGAPMAGTALAWAQSRRMGARGVLPSRTWPSFLELFVSRGVPAPLAVAFLLCWHAYLCVGAVALSALGWTWASALVGLVLVAAGLPLFYVSFQVIYGGRRPVPPHATPDGRNRVRILDVDVDRLTVAEALECVDRFVREGGTHLIITIDAGGCLRARHDAEFRRIASEAALVTPDGAGVVLAARLLDEPFHERVSGCDLVNHIAERSVERGYSIYLLGARPEVVTEARAALERKFPGVRIVGAMHGYYEPAEEADVIRAIAAARPDILFVAFGLPAQEKWISRHGQELGVPVCMGVGGTFDVLSGRVARAPAWVRRIWCEFLWRSVGNPRRIGRLRQVILFFIALALDAPRRIRQGM